jgi:UDP-3-O-[3-hydroxymyristoyl] glucosamine N-acyltransferase
VGPHAVISEGCRIGDRSIIGANVFIGAGCQIGEDVLIYPNVTIREYVEIANRVIIHSGSVIGSDGYGYETVDGEHEKIPHVGSVLIDDDVEIGANVCVDRGRFKKTWIQKGAKIDNLVQIAHNVVIGPNTLIVSQAGISGSTEIGKNVIIAGQAGIVGHITIGDHAIIGAGAGVPKSVPANAVVLGSPAKPIQEQKRLFAYISRLPEIFKDVAALKKKILPHTK